MPTLAKIQYWSKQKTPQQTHAIIANRTVVSSTLPRLDGCKYLPVHYGQDTAYIGPSHGHRSCYRGCSLVLLRQHHMCMSMCADYRVQICSMRQRACKRRAERIAPCLILWSPSPCHHRHPSLRSEGWYQPGWKGPSHLWVSQQKVSPQCAESCRSAA